MLALLLAAQLASPSGYMAKPLLTPTDDPAVVQARFHARQKCESPLGDLHHYSISATFPQLTAPGAPARAINRSIQQEVAALVSADTPDCPQPVRVTKEQQADGEIECECKVRLRNAALYSVECESSSGGEDFGAHPQTHISTLVFRLNDGHLMTVDEMLVNGARPKLRAVVRKNLDISGLIDPQKLSEGEIDGAVDAMLRSCLIETDSLTCEVPYWPLTYFTSVMPFDELSGIVRPSILKAARMKE